MNHMPAVQEVIEDKYLKPCVPYLARRKEDGTIYTVIRSDDRVIYVESNNTSNSSAQYFFAAFEVIREFIQGQDTVTIAAW